MSVKAARIIRITLLVFACLACIAGVMITRQIELKDARDITKISVTIIDKQISKNGNEYQMILTYKIQNNTKVDWAYLETSTDVYDPVSKKRLGDLNAYFGKRDGKTTVVKAGETVIEEVRFTTNDPNKVFMAVYNTPLSGLRLTSETTTGTYYRD